MVVRIARPSERIIFEERWTEPEFPTIEFWKGRKNLDFQYDKEELPTGLKLPEDQSFYGFRNIRTGEFFGIIVEPPEMMTEMLGIDTREIAKSMLRSSAQQLVLDEQIGKFTVYLRGWRYDKLVEISQKLNVPKDRLIRRALDRYFRDGQQLDEMLVGRLGAIVEAIDSGKDLNTIKTMVLALIEEITPKSSTKQTAEVSGATDVLKPVDDDDETLQKMVDEDVSER